jgi:hypothetical protein
MEGLTMKKWAVLFSFLLILAIGSQALAAGSLAVSGEPTLCIISNQQWRVIVTITGTAGTSGPPYLYPSLTLNPLTLAGDRNITGWYLYSVEVIPGTTAPTTTSVVGITDAYSVPLIGTGVTAPAGGQVFYMGTNGYPTFNGPWTVTFTGNSVSAATVTLILIFTAN